MKVNFFYSAFLVAGLIFAGVTGNRVYGQTPQNEPVKVQTVKYTCPMHPEVVQDLSGKCPKCGMNLVEKKDMVKGKMHQANDSTMLKHDNMKMKHDSSMMKKGQMIKDTTYRELEKTSK